MLKIYNVLNKYPLLIPILLLSSLFLLFYPSKYVNIDEHEYLRNAHLIINGDIKHSCNERDLGDFDIGTGCISKYNIGASIFFIPAILLNQDLVFLTTFIIFLISILVFYLILKELKLSTGFIYLFSLYPPFIYYSRTLFSEMFSIFLITSIIYLLIKFIKTDKLLYAVIIGVFSSLGIFVRYTNIIPLFLIISIQLLVNFLGDFRDETDSKKFNLFERIRLGLADKIRIKKLITQSIKILIPLIPLIFVIGYFNYVNYGGFLRSGYHFSNEEKIIINLNSIILFLKYFFLFNLIYPGMYLIMFINKSVYKYLIIISVLLTTVFYSIVSNITFSSGIPGLIISTRLLLPITPLLLLSYIFFLDKLKDKRYFKLLYVFTFIILIISTFFINYIHYRYLLTSNSFN